MGCQNHRMVNCLRVLYNTQYTIRGVLLKAWSFIPMNKIISKMYKISPGGQRYGLTKRKLYAVHFLLSNNIKAIFKKLSNTSWFMKGIWDKSFLSTCSYINSANRTVKKCKYIHIQLWQPSKSIDIARFYHCNK